MHLGKLVLLSAALVGAAAPAPYQYRFTAGKALPYRTILRSEFQVPDGSSKTMKLEAQSMVVFTPLEKTADGWKLGTETTRAKSSLDGREERAPKPSDTKRTVVVRPDGGIAGGDSETFAIVFPARPLARGDSFASERKGTGEAGLPLKTTYTLVDTAAQVRGYPGTVSLFEAKSELAGKTPGRKLTLKSGGGRIWFDAQAGQLVKSQLSYQFSEEVALPGLTQASVRMTTIHYDSELTK